MEFEFFLNPYEIDFTSMQQTNVKSGFVRKIRFNKLSSQERIDMNKNFNINK